MPENNTWTDRIIAQINAIECSIEQSDARELQLPRLVKIARRIGEFSDCAACTALQNRVTGLVKSLEHRLNREEKRQFLAELHLVIQHLHREHRLSSEGQNVAIGMSVGIAVGIISGAVIGNPGAGIAVGLALGLAAGVWLDARARKKGLVI